MKRIFFVLIILTFLASCIELEKVQEQIIDKEPIQPARSESKPSIEPKQLLLFLLNKHNSLKEYSATFQTINKQTNNTYAEQTTTISIKGDNFRTDGSVKIIREEVNRTLVLEEQRVKAILNANKYFECIYENEWLCAKTEISEQEANDLRAKNKDDDYIKFVEKATVKFLRDSEFEGQKTICFFIDGEECYLENSGIMVSSKKKDVEIRLLKYSSTVEDALFEFPKDAEEIKEDATN
jgi:outer membrane lipoprotein-sorting protein